jgi:uncharacterized protein (TIGR00369 family)
VTAVRSTSPSPDAQPPTVHPGAIEVGERLGPHFRDCYACGDRPESGLHLEVRRAEGVAIEAEFTVTDDHQGAPGLAHGGLLAAAFDDALGYVLWIIGEPAVTGRLEIDYLRPVPVGTTLHITARCTGVLGRKIWAEGEGRLGAPDGQVAVKAAALFIKVGTEHFEQHGRGLEELSEDLVRRYNP